MRWPVDIQIQLCQLFKDFVVADGIFQIRQVRTVRDRHKPLREFSDRRCIIVFFDVLSGAGNGYAVQHFKEIEVQHFQQIIGRAVARLPLAPCVERLLGISENLVNRAGSLQLTVNLRAVALIGELKLIF